MDQSSSVEKLEKSLSSVSDRNRDKMALSDWEFPDASPSVMSSFYSLNLSSANSILITNKVLTADGAQGSQFRKKKLRRML